MSLKLRSRELSNKSMKENRAKDPNKAEGIGLGAGLARAVGTSDLCWGTRDGVTGDQGQGWLCMSTREVT